MSELISFFNSVNNNFFNIELKLFLCFVGFFIIALLLSAFTIVCNKCKIIFLELLFAFCSGVFSLAVKISLALMVFTFLFKLAILILS